MLARAGISREISELQAVASRRPYSDVKADKWEYSLELPATMSESQRYQLQINLDLLTTTRPSFLIDDPDLLRETPVRACGGGEGKPRSPGSTLEGGM